MSSVAGIGWTGSPSSTARGHGRYAAKDLEPLDQLGHALAAIEAPYVREIGPLPERSRHERAPPSTKHVATSTSRPMPTTALSARSPKRSRTSRSSSGVKNTIPSHTRNGVSYSDRCSGHSSVHARVEHEGTSPRDRAGPPRRREVEVREHDDRIEPFMVVAQPAFQIGEVGSLFGEPSLLAVPRHELGLVAHGTRQAVEALDRPRLATPATGAPSRRRSVMYRPGRRSPNRRNRARNSSPPPHRDHRGHLSGEQAARNLGTTGDVGVVAVNDVQQAHSGRSVAATRRDATGLRTRRVSRRQCGGDGARGHRAHSVTRRSDAPRPSATLSRNARSCSACSWLWRRTVVDTMRCMT